MANAADSAQPTQTPTQDAQPMPMKPTIVGLYGISGCGKTHLLKQLKEELGEADFAYYDGSDKIASLVRGGLETFKKMAEKEKKRVREVAIRTIGEECTKSRRVGIVAGHYLLRDSDISNYDRVITEEDLHVYTHILHLKADIREVERHRQADGERKRQFLSRKTLEDWQAKELKELPGLCRNNDTLYSAISPPEGWKQKVVKLLREFRQHSIENSESCARNILDGIIATYSDKLHTMLVLDADKTLGAHDTGTIFWQKATEAKNANLDHSPDVLKQLFSSKLGYSRTAFRQAALMYEERFTDVEYDSLCNVVASEIEMYPAFINLLRAVEQKPHVRAVVITCGLRRVWDIVLERHGLSESVHVIGNGRLSDGIVVTGAVKAALVTHLQDKHNMYVCTFGDSPLDLEMFKKADKAIVVVGEVDSRSKSMDEVLGTAISQGLRAQQALIPETVPPRLDLGRLPIVKLTGMDLHDEIFSSLRVLEATNTRTEKLLTSATRNADISGPALRKAHARIGKYLAIEYLTKIIGLETYPMRHVQNKVIDGHRLLHEKQTTIVALMRGGEPMALGISDTFPLAMFVHAKDTADLKPEHLKNQRTVILVDSVINNGKTMAEFVECIRKLHATIKIVIVANVAQEKAFDAGGILAQTILRYGYIPIVTLRKSTNKYTGKGGTDTGARLFNTTHID